jgi:hypothetical protein
MGIFVDLANDGDISWGHQQQFLDLNCYFLVGGFKHGFFSIIYGIVIPID